jgi:hypothetical protein
VAAPFASGAIEMIGLSVPGHHGQLVNQVCVGDAAVRLEMVCHRP